MVLMLRWKSIILQFVFETDSAYVGVKNRGE